MKYSMDDIFNLFSEKLVGMKDWLLSLDLKVEPPNNYSIGNAVKGSGYCSGKRKFLVKNCCGIYLKEVDILNDEPLCLIDKAIYVDPEIYYHFIKKAFSYRNSFFDKKIFAAIADDEPEDFFCISDNKIIIKGFGSEYDPVSFEQDITLDFGLELRVVSISYAFICLLEQIMKYEKENYISSLSCGSYSDIIEKDNKKYLCFKNFNKLNDFIRLNSLNFKIEAGDIVVRLFEGDFGLCFENSDFDSDVYKSISLSLNKNQQSVSSGTAVSSMSGNIFGMFYGQDGYMKKDVRLALFKKQPFNFKIKMRGSILEQYNILYFEKNILEINDLYISNILPALSNQLVNKFDEFKKV